MKKFLMMATVFAFTAVMSQGMSLTPAYADDGGQPAVQAPSDGQANAEKLDKIKSRILQKLQERKEKMAKIESCVQAASDAQALKACMPERHGKRGGRGGDGGGFMRHHRGDNAAPSGDSQ